MRAEGLLALCFGLAACATLTRPEGSGGWTPERRRAELQQLMGLPLDDIVPGE